MTTIPIYGKKIDRKSPLNLRGLLLYIILGISFLQNTSCRRDNYPKPMAYPRLSYPKSDYVKTNNLPYPVDFEYPSFAKLEIPTGLNNGQNWINISFDKYRAKLLTGYFKADEKKIQQSILENESILKKETPPYAHIRKQEFVSNNKKVTGYLYEIEGNTANPVQFILTDRGNQLFRGTLYFDYIPNRDSIKDILDGLTVDVKYLMESFRFKKE